MMDRFSFVAFSLDECFENPKLSGCIAVICFHDMLNWHWFKFGVINFVIPFGIQLTLVDPLPL
jgi:hypothetical protein